MKKRLVKAFTIILALSMWLTSCTKTNGNESTSGTASDATTSTMSKNPTDKVIDTTEDVTEDKKDKFQDGDGIKNGSIVLSDSGITAGEGVNVSGNIATISKAGSYTVSGESNNAQIIIDTDKEDKVELILNGVNITCQNSAPIYAKKSKILILNIAEGTTNKITDGKTYTGLTDDEPNAAVFSKDDITVKGSGSLEVNANYNNGISTSNDLKIIGGNLTVNSKNTGLRGKDSVKIGLATNITVVSGGDAIKASNETDSGLGVIVITDGTIKINSDEDGLEAISSLVIKKGNIDITTGSGKQVTKNTSYKAVKCDKTVAISGGTFVINSADDALHCNDTLTISGGTFDITTNEDGIHADSSVKISGGSITIKKSYEGLEGKDVAISGGEIRITAIDDGINSAGGRDTADQNRPGRGGFIQNDSSCLISISGGLIVVDANGDGIDSNGSIQMTGGTVLVCGPTNDGNGPLDYDGSFTITGGFIVAAGSSGMAQGISNNSTQYGLLAGFDSKSANTIVRIEDSSGNDIVTFKPGKQYSSVAVSTPALKKGETYKLLFGGSCDGTLSDGLYSGGSYSGGTEYSKFTISSIQTTVGSIGRGGPGGGGKFGRP
jgi:hypothetical protein